MTKRKTAADMATEWRKFGRQVEAAGINWGMCRTRIFNRLMKRGISPEACDLSTTPRELAEQFQTALKMEKRWPLTAQELETLAWAWADSKIDASGASPKAADVR